jgi:hypothetical protein
MMGYRRRKKNILSAERLCMFEPLHAGKDLKFILYCFRLLFLLLLLEEFGSSEMNDWVSPLETNHSAPHFHAWQLTFNAIAMNKNAGLALQYSLLV